MNPEARCPAVANASSGSKSRNRLSGATHAAGFWFLPTALHHRGSFHGIHRAHRQEAQHRLYPAALRHSRHGWFLAVVVVRQGYTAILAMDSAARGGSAPQNDWQVV